MTYFYFDNAVFSIIYNQSCSNFENVKKWSNFLRKRTGPDADQENFEIRGPDRTRTKKISRPADRTGHGPRKFQDPRSVDPYLGYPFLN